MKVYSNLANIRATQCAWPNQGITGNISDGSLPDKKQHQDFARAVRDGTPLVREWNGQTYQWPRGSPIFMDLEPLWFGPMELEEKLWWHTEVAQWYLDIFPAAKLFSFTGTTPIGSPATITVDAYRAFMVPARQFLKRLSAITFGGYFGVTDDIKPACGLYRTVGINIAAALDSTKPLQFLTKGTFAQEWTDGMAGRPLTPDDVAKLCTFRSQHAEVRRQLHNYCDSFFVWSEPDEPYATEGAKLIEALA